MAYILCAYINIKKTLVTRHKNERKSKIIFKNLKKNAYFEDICIWSDEYLFFI